MGLWCFGAQDSGNDRSVSGGYPHKSPTIWDLRIRASFLKAPIGGAVSNRAVPS